MDQIVRYETQKYVICTKETAIKMPHNILGYRFKYIKSSL